MDLRGVRSAGVDIGIIRGADAFGWGLLERVRYREREKGAERGGDRGLGLAVATAADVRSGTIGAR
jgi:hypothetical protein